jgi:hypothetical protein
MRFGWKGRLFQFCILPFGLSLAPKVFTSLTKFIKAKLGSKGIRTIFYIDDILILGPSFNICLQNTREALHLLIQAGFIIHWEKSCLSPSRDFPFLGFVWNSVQATIRIPQEKIDSLCSQAATLSKLTSPIFRQVQVLTGLIVAFFRAVPLLRLKGRWLQISLNAVYTSEADLQKVVVLLPQARRSLKWILHLRRRPQLGPPQCYMLQSSGTLVFRTKINGFRSFLDW